MATTNQNIVSRLSSGHPSKQYAGELARGLYRSVKDRSGGRGLHQKKTREGSALFAGCAVGPTSTRITDEHSLIPDSRTPAGTVRQYLVVARAASSGSYKQVLTGSMRPVPASQSANGPRSINAVISLTSPPVDKITPEKRRVTVGSPVAILAPCSPILNGRSSLSLFPSLLAETPATHLGRGGNIPNRGVAALCWQSSSPLIGWAYYLGGSCISSAERRCEWCLGEWHQRIFPFKTRFSAETRYFCSSHCFDAREHQNDNSRIVDNTVEGACYESRATPASVRRKKLKVSTRSANSLLVRECDNVECYVDMPLRVGAVRQPRRPIHTPDETAIELLVQQRWPGANATVVPCPGAIANADCCYYYALNMAFVTKGRGIVYDPLNPNDPVYSGLRKPLTLTLNQLPLNLDYDAWKLNVRMRGHGCCAPVGMPRPVLVHRPNGGRMVIAPSVLQPDIVPAVGQNNDALIVINIGRVAHATLAFLTRRAVPPIPQPLPQPQGAQPLPPQQPQPPRPPPPLPQQPPPPQPAPPLPPQPQGPPPLPPMPQRPPQPPPPPPPQPQPPPPRPPQPQGPPPPPPAPQPPQPPQPPPPQPPAPPPMPQGPPPPPPPPQPPVPPIPQPQPPPPPPQQPQPPPPPPPAPPPPPPPPPVPPPPGPGVPVPPGPPPRPLPVYGPAPRPACNPRLCPATCPHCPRAVQYAGGITGCPVPRFKWGNMRNALVHDVPFTELLAWNHYTRDTVLGPLASTLMLHEQTTQRAILELESANWWASMSQALSSLISVHKLTHTLFDGPEIERDPWMSVTDEKGVARQIPVRGFNLARKFWADPKHEPTAANCAVLVEQLARVMTNLDKADGTGSFDLSRNARYMDIVNATAIYARRFRDNDLKELTAMGIDRRTFGDRFMSWIYSFETVQYLPVRHVLSVLDTTTHAPEASPFAIDCRKLPKTRTATLSVVPVPPARAPPPVVANLAAAMPNVIMVGGLSDRGRLFAVADDHVPEQFRELTCQGVRPSVPICAHCQCPLTAGVCHMCTGCGCTMNVVSNRCIEACGSVPDLITQASVKWPLVVPFVKLSPTVTMNIRVIKKTGTKQLKTLSLKRKYDGPRSYGLWTSRRFPVSVDLSRGATITGMMRRQGKPTPPVTPSFWKDATIVVRSISCPCTRMRMSVYIQNYVGAALKKILAGLTLAEDAQWRVDPRKHESFKKFKVFLKHELLSKANHRGVDNTSSASLGFQQRTDNFLDFNSLAAEFNAAEATAVGTLLAEHKCRNWEQFLDKFDQGSIDLSTVSSQRNGHLKDAIAVKTGDYKRTLKYIEDAFAPRLISYQGLLLNAFTGRTTQSVYKLLCHLWGPEAFLQEHFGIPDTRPLPEHALRELYTNPGFILGSGVDHKRMSLIFHIVHLLIKAGYVCVENDYSMYDATQGSLAFECFRVFMWECIGDQVFDQVHRDHARSTLSSNWGDKLKTNAGMKSGTPYTTLQNSVLNATVVCTAILRWLRKMGHKNVTQRSIRRLVCIIVAGDDSLILLHPELVAMLETTGDTVASQLATQVEQSGFSCKMKRVGIEDATFLACQWWPAIDADGREVDSCAPELSRWAYKQGWSLHEQPDPEAWYTGVMKGFAPSFAGVPILGELLAERAAMKHTTTAKIQAKIDADIGKQMGYKTYLQGAGLLRPSEYGRTLLKLRHPFFEEPQGNPFLRAGLDRSGFLDGILRGTAYDILSDT